MSQHNDDMMMEDQEQDGITTTTTTTTTTTNTTTTTTASKMQDDEEDDDFQMNDDAPATEENQQEEEEEEGTTPSIFTHSLHQPESLFKCAAFSKFNKKSNSTNLISFYASQDDTASAIVYNLSSYEQLYQQQMKGFHDDSVVDLQMNFDGTMLATAGMDGTIGIYDISKFQDENLDFGDGSNPTAQENLVDHKVQLTGPDSEIEWIKWHPKGNALLSASSDGTCWLWNVKKMDCMNVLAGHSDSITCGDFTADGKLIVTGSLDSTVRVWQPMQGQSIHTFEGDLFSERAPVISLHVRKDDSKVMYVGTAAGDVLTCGILDTPRVLQKYTGGHKDSVESIDYSHFMEHIIVTGSMDHSIGVWDDRVNKIRVKLQSTEGIIKVACSKRAPLVFSCGMDKEIKVWDLRNGQCLDRFVGHTEGVLDFALLNNEEQLISASDDGTSRIFDTNLDVLLGQ